MPDATLRPLPSFWRLQLLGWSAFLVAMTFSRVGRFPLSYMLVEKLLLTALGVVASLALRAALRPRVDAGRPMAVLIALCVVASYAIAAVWTAAFNVLAIPITNAMLGREYAIRSIGDLMSGSVYHSFSLVAWGFLYIGIRHYLALLDERERSLRLEASASTARLRALQYQLNPHLFFNTLNAISTLVVERRNDDAALMIARLADFLRLTLRQDHATQVSLADELSFIGQYLDIEQVRFGDRLDVRYDIEEDAYRALVPLLLLQPLVENAIRHGIAPGDGRGTIAIAARRLGPELDLTIENSGPARPPSEGEAARIGLANVRERLAVLYPDRHDVVTRVLPGGGFRVELRLPYVAQVHVRAETPGDAEIAVGR